MTREQTITNLKSILIDNYTIEVEPKDPFDTTEMIDAYITTPSGQRKIYLAISKGGAIREIVLELGDGESIKSKDLPMGFSALGGSISIPPKSVAGQNIKDVVANLIDINRKVVI